MRLQVQQSLLQQYWPPAIRYDDDWEGSCHLSNLLTGSQSNQHKKLQQQQHQQNLQGSPSFDLDDLRGGRGSLENPRRVRGWLSDQSDRGDPGVTSDSAAASGDSPAKDRWRSFLSSRSITSFVSHTRSTSPGAVLPVTTGYTSGGSPSKARGKVPAASSGGSRRQGWFQQLLRARGNPGCLFKGLRVRMGVATGVVAKGQKVKNSQLYQRAQGEIFQGGARWGFMVWDASHIFSNLTGGFVGQVGSKHLVMLQGGTYHSLLAVFSPHSMEPWSQHQLSSIPLTPSSRFCLHVEFV
jgi:hypothetical protein